MKASPAANEASSQAAEPADRFRPLDCFKWWQKLAGGHAGALGSIRFGFAREWFPALRRTLLLLMVSRPGLFNGAMSVLARLAWWIGTRRFG